MEKRAYEHKKQWENFSAKLAGAEKLETVGKMSRLIRSYIKEGSFAAKILPPEQVDESECIPSFVPQDDTFQTWLYKEPDGRAQFLTFRGTGHSEYIYADKVLMPFGAISTRKFEKSEEEMRVYRGINLVEMIEANAAKALADIQDNWFMTLVRAAVAGNGMDISAGGAPFNKETLITLLNAPIQNKLRVSVLLMTESTYNNFGRQSAEIVSDQFVNDVVMKGMVASKVLAGMPIITTMKTEIINDNEIFAFPAPEYMGKFYELDSEKFIVKKDDGLISWYSRKNMAIGLANVNGIIRMRLNGYED